MLRKNLRRSGGEQLEEISAAQQSMENIDSVCSQRQVSDVCEPTNMSDQTVVKGENNENTSSEQQGVQLSSSSNTSLGNIPKAIPTNEADMNCTTTENVSHVRFEWTVEDFYPQMYECGDMIQSEEFPPYDIQKEFWTLRLYPKGYQRLSTDDNSTIQFYLTLCPSHVSSNQIQIYFRALINFSNRQGRILHTETVQNCGGNITEEFILMKMTRSLCEEFYKESTDNLIISIELVSIDDITKRSMKTSTTKIIEGSSRVISKVMKMKLRWKIEQFSILVNESSNNSFIESCEFTFNKQRNTTNNNNIVNLQDDDENDEQLLNGTKSLNDIPSHQWSLILYPNGKTERFKESLSIFLEHTFGPSVRVVIRFSLIDERGRKINTKQLPSHVLAVGERWGVGDFMKHSMLLQNQQELIPGNELRIYCQIKILERQSIDEKKFISRPLIALPSKSQLNTTTINDDPATYWPSLFYKAYLDKKMIDMYLKCANELFPVHKLIIALRSSVLAKMIKEKEIASTSTTKTIRHSKRSNATNDNMEIDSQTTSGSEDSSSLTIDINDIDCKTIPYFIEYIYTGGIKKLALPGAVISHTLVIDLLTIASNYDIPDLRIYAEYYLKDIIRVDNACELLILSDNIKSETLKQTTCDFIANNLGNIMETTGWTELKAKQSDLIDIILKSCLLLRK